MNTKKADKTPEKVRVKRVYLKEDPNTVCITKTSFNRFRLIVFIYFRTLKQFVLHAN